MWSYLQLTDDHGSSALLLPSRILHARMLPLYEYINFENSLFYKIKSMNELLLSSAIWPLYCS